MMDELRVDVLNTQLKLVFVLEPDRDPPVTTPYRLRPQRFDSFVDAIEREARGRVVRMRCPLKDLEPTDEFILLASEHPASSLAECAHATRAELASRLVILEAIPSEAVETLLEPFSAAAAIDSFAQYTWELAKWGGDDAGLETRGIYGLRSIALQIGAACERKSARYGYLTTSDSGDLPRLLCTYLRALTVADATRTRASQYA